MRSRVLATGAMAALLLLPTLSCSSADETQGVATASAAPPDATSSSPASEPADPPSPSPQPATGDLITVSLSGRDLLSVRLPTPTWRVNEFNAGLASLTTAVGSWDISSDAVETSANSTIDNHVAGVLGSPSSLGVKERRSSDRTVAGVMGYVVEGRGREGRAYEFGASYEGYIVSITFEFPQDNARAETWIEAVLASATWL